MLVGTLRKTYIKNLHNNVCLFRCLDLLISSDLGMCFQWNVFSIWIRFQFFIQIQLALSFGQSIWWIFITIFQATI